MSRLARQMSLEQEIADSICSTAGPPVRAVKLAASKSRPRFVVDSMVLATSSLSHDLELIADLFQEDQACAVVASLKERKDASADFEAQWHIITWIPESMPPKEKEALSTCAEVLKQRFPSCTFKEVKVVSVKEGLITFEPGQGAMEEIVAQQERPVTLRWRKESNSWKIFDVSDASETSTECGSGGSDIEETYEANWSAVAPPLLESSELKGEGDLPAETAAGNEQQADGDEPQTCTTLATPKPPRFECKDIASEWCMQQ